jgi:PhzF family phenazine biosynthesis protein
MSVPIYQVDAFSDRAFGGNPAAVCLLDEDRPESWMQAVAAEMNLSETAFLRSNQDGVFGLRWFTPVAEVDLCGHATLASAHILWQEAGESSKRPLRFSTRSGELRAESWEEGGVEMDFPALPIRATEAPAGLAETLGVEPVWVGRGGDDLLIEVDGEDQVRAAEPDFRRLAMLPVRGVIVTARSDDPDFDVVSRFFAPAFGVDEDPVTGSAHCALGPFWADRLDLLTLRCFQASQRGGRVEVQVEGERVLLRGRAITVLRGQWVG